MPFKPAVALHIGNHQVHQLIAPAFDAALANLFDINTIAYDPAIYNRTGLMSADVGVMIRAGGDYQTPWTRDASINCWTAASQLAPGVARNTLWAVCERRPDGRLIVQQDNQWWDQAIWIGAAWHHYVVTGDVSFLTSAYEVAVETLRQLETDRYDTQFGLFRGPAVLADGIAGYPDDVEQPGNNSSFILDHPGGDQLMCLSTNFVYVSAYRSASLMAHTLGDAPAAAVCERRANELHEAIDRQLWLGDEGRYAYFVYGSGERRGQLDRSQEGMGLAYAILFGQVDPARAEQIITQTHREPLGVCCVWPPFGRYSRERPGRHNNVYWPLLAGAWGHAARAAGRGDHCIRELLTLARLWRDSGEYFEIYNAVTAQPDGGIQNDKQWESCRDQTWSATAFIRLVLYGLMGIQFSPGGMSLRPIVPAEWGEVTILGLPYRDARLNIQVRPRPAGSEATTTHVPATANGHIELRVMGESVAVS